MPETIRDTTIKNDGVKISYIAPAASDFKSAERAIKPVISS